jgi:hypothetical protein
LQITHHQAVDYWHYFNGDQDELSDDDEDAFSEADIKGCQSDTDEEPQPNPYPK